MSSSAALRSLASRAAFPALLVGSPLAAVGLLRAEAPAGLAVTTALLGALTLITAIERWLPHEPGWWPTDRDKRTDLTYLATLLVPDKLARLLAEGAAAALTLAGAALLDGHRLLSGAPVLLLALLAFLLGDLGKYVVHRLSHERPSLWPIHAVHHAPDRLYALNGLRVHPLNIAWNTFLDVLPALLLGLPPVAVVALGALRGALSLFQHANFPVRPGLLAFVFNTPNAHRWHHARSIEASRCNYGSSLILWDRLFGTFRAGHPDEHPADLGFDGATSVPRSWAGQVVYPLCRERLLETCFTPRVRELLR